MRKIIFFVHASLDGFISDSNGGLEWITYTDELADYAYSMHTRTDAALYGRVTWGMMEGYWLPALTNPDSTPGELDHARWLDKATKIVVSKTLDSIKWEKNILIRENLSEEINKIKAQEGKDIWLLGSPSLARSMMELDLIDEYRINVNPVILGQGQALFGALANPLNLKLTEIKTLSSGVVCLCYERAAQS